jgi:hypothetical protein
LRTFGWCVLHAVELHAIVFLVALPWTTGPKAEQAAPAASDAVEVDQAAPEEVPASPAPSSPVLPPPASTARSPTPRPSFASARPLASASRGSSTPAAASSAVALADVGAPLPVALAASYPGGLTSSDGTANAYVDALLGGFGGTLGGDLSAPARLGGIKTWGACRADGVPDLTYVRVRVLVRPDGTALRVESVDPPGFVSDTVLRGAMPCAMREHYIHGRDRAGQPAERWTLPFRVEVLGLLR